MKSVLIVGLGRFGRHLARQFYLRDNEVMVIDIDEQIVNDALSYVTNAQIGNATNEAFISSLGVRNFDICIVAIGNDFQSSLEATALLKDMGAKFVVSRACRDVQAKFLLRNGADEVVYAEKEMAERMAAKYGTDNIFDYVELSDDYSIYEIATPPSWYGKSILQKAVRTKYHVSILATKEHGQINPLPKPEHIFTPTETLIIMSHNDDMRKLVK